MEYNEEGFQLFVLPLHTLKASAEVRMGSFPNLRAQLLRGLGAEYTDPHKFFRTFDNATNQETVTVEVEVYVTDKPAQRGTL